MQKEVAKSLIKSCLAGRDLCRRYPRIIIFPSTHETRVEKCRPRLHGVITCEMTTAMQRGTAIKEEAS